MKPVLAVTMGDPGGIGPEVAVRALGRPGLVRRARLMAVGDPAVLKAECRRLLPRPIIHPVAGPEEVGVEKNAIYILGLNQTPPSERVIGRADPGGARAAAQALRTAVDLAVAGRVAGIVTAPIGKEGFHAAGYSYPGHTELLADWTRSQAAGMLMVLPPRPRDRRTLRILLATTHLALRDLSKQLTIGGLLTTFRLAHRAARDLFHLSHPRLAVAALNPHAGEGGLFGREEEEIIRPALAAAQEEGIPLTGPWPADTLIHRAYEGHYDLVVAMYHDQALIPIKLLGFGRAVNVTVGLPFIRTSPDHGTAYDIAGKGVADAGSMAEAIRLAADLAAGK